MSSKVGKVRVGFGFFVGWLVFGWLFCKSTGFLCALRKLLSFLWRRRTCWVGCLVFLQSDGQAGFSASGSYFCGLPGANFAVVCGVVCLFVGLAGWSVWRGRKKFRVAGKV